MATKEGKEHHAEEETKAHTWGIDDLYAHYNIDAEQGYTHEQVIASRAAYGENR